MAGVIFCKAFTPRMAVNSAGTLKVAKKLLSPCLVNVTQSANITAPSHLSHAEKSTKEKVKPWPYDKRTYNIWWSFIDGTEKRLDENSKIIVVEGMPAVGKSEFAKSLAKELGFHYLSEGTIADRFYSETYQADFRSLNKIMPNTKYYDLEDFLTEENPQSGIAGRFQLDLYIARFLKYADALKHLLNTGQGVVCDRSVFSDNIYADALRVCGFMKPGGLSFYNRVRVNTICELWKPHLTIYLDSNVKDVRDKINQRNNPIEKNSKNLSDNFLSAIQRGYMEKFLPEMRKYGEVLIYDSNELEDWEVVIEDIERLNLEQDPEDEIKFENWTGNKDLEWSYYRRYFSSHLHMRKLFGMMEGPWDAPEMITSHEENFETLFAAHQHPYFQYDANFNPHRGASMMNILLGMKSNPKN